MTESETKHRIGCQSWQYDDWITRAGGETVFYPRGTKAGEMLGLYSRVFDTIEVDSTAYGTNNGILPGEGQVPLFDYLDALPEGIDLSTEAQFPSDYTYTGAEWAKITVERIHKFLQRYEAYKEHRSR